MTQADMLPLFDQPQPKKKKRKRFHRSQRPRDLLLVRRVDDLLDLLNRSITEEESAAIVRSAFPLAERLKDCWRESADSDRVSFRVFTGGHVWSYALNRMRRAWHPDARSYVYAFAFKPCYDDPSFNEKFWENWEADGVVKIGWAYDPAVRVQALTREFYHQFGRELGPARLSTQLLSIPLARANAGEYLESDVLGWLRDYSVRGEWFWDMYGVIARLFLLFARCHLLYCTPINSSTTSTHP